MKKKWKKLHVSVVAEVYSDWWGAWQEIREIGKILSVELCGHEIHGFFTEYCEARKLDDNGQGERWTK